MTPRILTDAEDLRRNLDTVTYPTLPVNNVLECTTSRLTQLYKGLPICCWTLLGIWYGLLALRSVGEDQLWLITGPTLRAELRRQDAVVTSMETAESVFISD